MAEAPTRTEPSQTGASRQGEHAAGGLMLSPAVRHFRGMTFASIAKQTCIYQVLGGPLMAHSRANEGTTDPHLKRSYPS